MASLRDIKLRIRAVKNIAQITQAMKMVAAAKLRRVQERVEKGKPYSATMSEMVGLLAPNVRDFAHPLLDTRPVARVGIVVIAADKGLCGSYNTNVLRVGHQFIDRQVAEHGAQNVRLLTVGRKATDYFKRRNYNIDTSFLSIGDKGSFEQVRAISNAITGMFLSGGVDEVHVVYTEFRSVISQKPQAIKFLPIEPPTGEDAEASASGAPGGPRQDFIFEPKVPDLLSALLPRFVETRVYQLLLEGVASEFGARMTAMTNATKNAKDQAQLLTLEFNRTRQANITKELLDIVGGAEALNG
jgi:F-type H+-transporting ATPase subunit gamma